MPREVRSILFLGRVFVKKYFRAHTRKNQFADEVAVTFTDSLRMGVSEVSLGWDFFLNYEMVKTSSRYVKFPDLCPLKLLASGHW